MHHVHETKVRYDMAQARTVAPETTIGDLLRLFATDQVNAFPVVSGGRLLGTASRDDALKAFAPKPGCGGRDYDATMGTTVDEIMTRDMTILEIFPIA